MSDKTYSQIRDLLTSIAEAAPDGMDCDGCFAVIAEFAEAELRGEGLPAALAPVRAHISQCRCCAYEYATLLEAVRSSDATVPTGSEQDPHGPGE